MILTAVTMISQPLVFKNRDFTEFTFFLFYYMYMYLQIYK